MEPHRKPPQTQVCVSVADGGLAHEAPMAEGSPAPPAAWHAYLTSQLKPWIAVRPPTGEVSLYMATLCLTLLRDGQRIPRYRIVGWGETADEACTLVVHTLNRQRVHGAEVVGVGAGDEVPPCPSKLTPSIASSSACTERNG